MRPEASSPPESVDAYLAALTPERREFVGVIRDTVLAHLPDGYEEGIQYGMIGYYLPLERYPDTYNGQPLGVAALASQKRHVSLYLMCVYGSEARAEWLKRAFAERDLRLDMGKSCLRFRRLDEVPLDVVGEAIAACPPEEFIRLYEAARNR